jgi:hypothetical protein
LPNFYDLAVGSKTHVNSLGKIFTLKLLKTSGFKNAPLFHVMSGKYWAPFKGAEQLEKDQKYNVFLTAKHM